MWTRGIFTSLLIAAATPFTATAGDLGKIHRNVVTINVARPPEVLLRGKTIAIKSVPGAAHDDPRGLEQEISRALSDTYTPSPASPDMTLTLAVSNYQRVAARVEHATERRGVKVKKTVKNIITGKPMVVETTEMQDVVVSYWVGQGSLAANISVQTAAGFPLDNNFSPKVEYAQKIEIAEGRTPKNRAPTPQESLAELHRKIAGEVAKRYVRTTEPLKVMLAMDDPLHAGNDRAMQGRWTEALALWTAVAPNSKIQADRLYNMGVANEALAYAAYAASGNIDSAEAHYQQAIQSYLEASKLDPGEKYFQDAKDRCERLRTNYARAKEQRDAIQRQAIVTEIQEQQRAAEEEARKAEEEARKQREAEQKEKDKAELTSNRPDSPDEAEFRNITRLKLRSQPGKPSALYAAQLNENGQRTYKLTAVQSQRVVGQEIERLDHLQEYRDTFKELIARDKTIDRPRRDSLTKLAARYTLTPDEVKSIESEFQFKDLTAPLPATTAETKPAAPKPVPTPKAKPTTRPTTPPAPKPSIPAQPESAIKK